MLEESLDTSLSHHQSLLEDFTEIEIDGVVHEISCLSQPLANSLPGGYMKRDREGKGMLVVP